MNIIQHKNDLQIFEAENFILNQTLDCGQAFRWQEVSSGIWQGVAYGKKLKLGAESGVITLYDTDMSDDLGHRFNSCYNPT